MNSQLTTQYIKLENQPSYRQTQLNNAIFKQLVPSINKITTFSKELRTKIEKKHTFPSIKAVTEKISKNRSTIKVLFESLQDNKQFESVLMQHNDGRNTVCVSSQIGCSLACKFCATGSIGFMRNLTFQEIVDQVLYFSRKLNQKDKNVTNIVYMGMGEPFLNPQNVSKSIKILTDPDQFEFGSRRITISTVGIIPAMKKFFSKFPQINLAISLHAATQSKRKQIMPKAAVIQTVSELAKYINSHIKATHRRISLEYIMLNNINDTKSDIDAIDKFFKQINNSAKKLIHINLIAYNDTGSIFTSSSPTKINNFQNNLRKLGINSTIRISMGKDLNAACGMLANKT